VGTPCKGQALVLTVCVGVQTRRAMVAFGLQSESKAVVAEVGGGAWGARRRGATASNLSPRTALAAPLGLERRVKKQT